WLRSSAGNRTQPRQVAPATFDPRSERWRRFAPLVVDQLLKESSDHVKRWISALRPVRPMLIEPLSDVSHDPARGQVATDVLIQLAKDDPETLVRLILDAEPRSSAPLIEALKPYGPRARHALAAVMAESVLPRWDDPPPSIRFGATRIPPSRRRSKKQAGCWASDLRSARRSPMNRGGCHALSRAV